MSTINKILADNMKRARKRLGYSQMDLAGKTNLSLGYIGDLEAGKKFPSGRALENISKALFLKPYQLIMEDPSENEPMGFDNMLSELHDRFMEDVFDIMRRYREK